MQLAAAFSCQSCSCRQEDVNVLKVATAYCHYRGSPTLLSMFSGLNTTKKHTKLDRKKKERKRQENTLSRNCLAGRWLNLEDFKPCSNCFSCHLGRSRLGFDPSCQVPNARMPKCQTSRQSLLIQSVLFLFSECGGPDAVTVRRVLKPCGCQVAQNIWEAQRH